ncbi:MAG: NAD(+)/NADH kinase [Alphaproteobacteria bacterium]|nr:NAD(+)/NADH kinase [Alphaproteobacteria bacterium]
MHAHLFHNPKSGTADHAIDELEAVLRLSGYEVTSFSTKAKDFARELAKPCDLIVAAGGDGTVGKILKLMPDRKIPVAILPLGTANNIASSLGIKGEPEEIAQTWTPGRKRLMSVGRCTGPWGETPFIEAVGFGAMVDATEKGLADDKEGKSRLLMGRDAFLRAIKKAKPRDLEVTIDGKAIKGDLIALEILNCGYAGPGIPLCLTAKPGDALLDIVAIRESQREAMMDWIGATEETTKPPVTVTRGRKVIIHWKGKPGMRVDDGHIAAPGGDVTVTIELERKPVTVLVPPRAKVKPLAPRRKAKARNG